MHRQPIVYPPVTTYMITARETEMEGLPHPSAAVKETTRLNRPRVHTQHRISDRWKPQTSSLALMRQGSGLQLSLVR